MKDIIQIGLDKGLTSFNEDRSRIRYNWQKKERNDILSPVFINYFNSRTSITILVFYDN